MVGTRCKVRKEVNMGVASITIIIILITIIITSAPTMARTIIANDVMVVIISIIHLMVSMCITSGHQVSSLIVQVYETKGKEEIEIMVLLITYR